MYQTTLYCTRCELGVSYLTVMYVMSSIEPPERAQRKQTNGMAAQDSKVSTEPSLATSQADPLAELDAPRLSLLDVVRQKAESLGLLEKIHRVLVCLKYGKPSDSGDNLKEMLESLIDSEQAADEQGGIMTGILLMYPLCCVLLLEGPQRLVVGTLRKIKETKERSADLISSVHMFLSIQDAPGRSFPFFSSKALQHVSKADPSAIDKEQLVTVIPEMSINLQKIGRKVANFTSTSDIN
jgi:hypothetical protein